jgi:hypothetical protein
VNAADTGYDVAVNREQDRWRVRISDPGGGTVAERTCSDAAEARTFASTVRQHLYWLSAPTFRAYYRLPD